MAFSVRFEEYVPLGSFLMVSFSRDQREIEGKFPKLNVAYMGDFQGQIDKVKQLEGKLHLTEKQKAATQSLYAKADELNGNLNFLSSYMRDAELSTTVVSEVKEELHRDDIEAAVLGLRNLKPYVVAHQAALEANGMATNFLTYLDDTIVILEDLNTLQNSVMNARKELVRANILQYKDLYSYISTVAEKGKLVFKGSGKEDEYIITNIIARMRAPERKDKE
ncbi:hypothetical protein [Flavobacterium sp. SM2513]|uniref:hypothetical protein n=1 Tax=Flavobacterium sp. SM2513 TaxID=3424766 RepID=UPI003D7FCEAE